MMRYHTLPEPGQKLRGDIWVNERMQLPVWAVSGAAPGPTLVVTAGVHGCEYVGVLAAKRLYEGINPAGLRGQIVILPAVNSTGLYQGARQIVPEDGKNLNRVFPGKADGTDSEQLAYAIEHHIYPHADFLLDLHGGDVGEAMEPLVFFSNVADKAVVEQSRAAAACLHVGYRIPSAAENGLYSYAARQGIPSLLQEIGGEGRWTGAQVEQCVASVYSLLGHLGMMGAGKVNPAQREALETVYEQADADGLWYPDVSAGQSIRAGAVLGVLEDLHGAALQRITARFDGVVLYFTTALGVCESEPLIAYARC